MKEKSIEQLQAQLQKLKIPPISEKDYISKETMKQIQAEEKKSSGSK